MAKIPVSAKKVFQGHIFAAWQWKQKLYNGTTGTFEMISRPDYGTVIGVLPNNQVLLTQDEQPHRPAVLTTAGGKIEEGESPEEGARREFLEETGYSIGTLTPYFKYSPSEKAQYTVHMFIGRNLKNTGQATPEPGEKVEIRIFSFDDFVRLGNSDSTDIGGPVRDWMLRMKLLEAQIDKHKRDGLYSLLYD